MSIPKDEPDRCVFYFADGRRCSMPGFPGDMGLCYYHAHKYRHKIKAEQAGALISEYLNHDALTASDLAAGFATLFRAAALGHFKPKTVFALTYLGQLLFQAQKAAKEEFREAFQTPWREVVRESLVFNAADESRDPNEPASPHPAAPLDTTLSTGAASDLAPESPSPSTLDPDPESPDDETLPHKIM